MLPSNVIKFVKTNKDADKILKIFDGYMKKIKYPPMEVFQNTLLCLAVEYSHLQLVKSLARRGADVNFHEKHPSAAAFHVACQSPAALHVACQGGNPHLIQLLLDLGADVQMVATCVVHEHRDPLVNPNTKGIPKTAMEVVLYQDDPTLMAILLPHYDVEKELERQSVLHVASKTGAFDCVKFLLGQKDVQVNVADAAGRSALFFAMQHEPRLVELLLNHGSDPNLVTLSTKREKGSTALHHLVEIPRYLRLSRSNSNLSSLQNGDFLIKLKLLLEAGANVNHVLTDGHSPLSLLCFHAVNLIGNHIKNSDVNAELVVLMSDSICKAVSTLLEYGAVIETKHGLNAFRTLFGEGKKWFARVHHSFMMKDFEKKQAVLNTVSKVLQIVLKIATIILTHPSAELKEADLRFVLSTKTVGHGKFGIRRADLVDLDWSLFESLYSEITRLSILTTNFQHQNVLPVEDTIDFVDVASFPLVFEKLLCILQVEVYREVITKLEHIEPYKNNIDTSEIQRFLSDVDCKDGISLKRFCRYTIFHSLRKPRQKSIQYLTLPESLKRFIALHN